MCKLSNYYERKCTCGKWQTHRFTCSHAIAVCRHRIDSPITLVYEAYTTSTYQRQYDSDFLPLPHIGYWRDPGWNIQADDLKLVATHGRRHQNRI